MKTLRKLLPAAFFLAAILFSCSKQEQDTQKEDKPSGGDEPKTETPVIKTTNLELPEAAAGSYILEVVVDNPSASGVLSATTKEETAWITSCSAEGTSVKVTVTDNLSAAREATLVLSYTGAQNVEVTLKQPQWNWSVFNIEMTELGPFGATFKIDRNPGYGGGYYYEVLDKWYVDKLVEDDTHKPGDFEWADAVYQSDVDYLKRMVSMHGHASLEDLLKSMPSMYSTASTITIPFSKLEVDTDYVFKVYGMEASDAATRKTPVCVYLFHTEYASLGDLSFTGEATDITETSAEITLRPSSEGFYWLMAYASEIEWQSTSPAKIMESGIAAAKEAAKTYSVDDILGHGTETNQIRDLLPGTKYYIVAWGMDRDLNSTSQPFTVLDFTTSQYEVSDDCTFQIDVLEIQDMDIKVKVTPSNTDTRYYIGFVAKSKMAGYSDDQAAQRIIDMENKRISEGYYDVPNLSWATLPGLLPGVREVWGRKDEGWLFEPRTDYRIYVFGIDYFGIRTTNVGAIDVTTADPRPSDNTFQVTIDKNTWQGLDFTVTPSNNDDYWLTFLAEKADIEQYCRYPNGDLNEDVVMDWAKEYYEDEINQRTHKGTVQLHEHTTPGTEYILMVFGYSGSYTTHMLEVPFTAELPPFNKSTADFTYTYRLFRGEDLADMYPDDFSHADVDGDCIMLVRFDVTPNAVHWYFGAGWGPAEQYKETGGIYHLMNLDMDSSVPGSATQDKKFWRSRPWWYGLGEGYQWIDEEGDFVNHWPWSISGWAEDADGNYGPWHYELYIPVPVPAGSPGLGKYEVGYSPAEDYQKLIKGEI